MRYNPLDDLQRMKLRPDAMADLRRRGITTLSQLAGLSDAELRSIKGIKTSAPRLQAQARAYLQQAPVLFGPLPPSLAGACAMFDIETVPFGAGSGRAWSLGAGMAPSSVGVIVVAPVAEPYPYDLPDGCRITLVPDDAALWRVFADRMCQGERIYHWTGFDADVMRRTAPPDVTKRMTALLDDLHRHTRRAVAFPVNSLSLKPVAQYLGFRWSAYDAWDAAWWDYQRWLQSGDARLLAQACAYQRDDVRAMFVVRDCLLELAASAP
jgi:uncharacterized protein